MDPIQKNNIHYLIYPIEFRRKVPNVEIKNLNGKMEQYNVEAHVDFHYLLEHPVESCSMIPTVEIYPVECRT